MWPLVLGHKPFKCQESHLASIKCMMAGALHWNLLGEITALPQIPSGGEGAGCLRTSTSSPHLAFQALGFGPSGLPVPTPKFSK